MGQPEKLLLGLIGPRLPPLASPTDVQEGESSDPSGEARRWEVSRFLTVGKSLNNLKNHYGSQNQPNKRKQKTG